MRWLMLATMVVFASGSLAHSDESPINSQQELVAWCEAESLAWFIGQRQTPFNWSASWWEEGNVLRVKGSWRVDGQARVVECSVARGAQRRYARMVVQ